MSQSEGRRQRRERESKDDLYASGMLQMNEKRNVLLTDELGIVTLIPDVFWFSFCLHQFLNLNERKLTELCAPL